MTVADIKEYIDEVENKYLKAELIPIFTNANLEEIITNLRSMLDELEPKAKWKYNRDNFIGVECSNCNHYFFFDDLPIKEHLKMNYCANCGARMEVEDDTTPTNV